MKTQLRTTTTAVNLDNNNINKINSLFTDTDD